MERAEFHSAQEAIQAALNRISELTRIVDSLVIENQVLQQRIFILTRVLLIDASVDQPRCVDQDRLKMFTSMHADILDKAAAGLGHPDAVLMLKAVAMGVRESLSEIDSATTENPTGPKLTLIPGGKSEK